MLSDNQRRILNYVKGRKKAVLSYELEDAFPEDYEILDTLEELRASGMVEFTGTEVGGFGRYLLTKDGEKNLRI